MHDICGTHFREYDPKWKFKYFNNCKERINSYCFDQYFLWIHINDIIAICVLKSLFSICLSRLPLDICSMKCMNMYYRTRIFIRQSEVCFKSWAWQWKSLWETGGSNWQAIEETLHCKFDCLTLPLFMSFRWPGGVVVRALDFRLIDRSWVR